MRGVGAFGDERVLMGEFVRVRYLVAMASLLGALPAAAVPRPSNDSISSPHVIETLPFTATEDFRGASWSDEEPVPCHDQYAQLLGRPVPSEDPGALWPVIREDPGTLWYRLDPEEDAIISPYLYRHYGSEVIGLGVYELSADGPRLIACSWPEGNEDWTRPIPLLARADVSYLIVADLRHTPYEAVGSVHVFERDPWDLHLTNLHVEAVPTSSALLPHVASFEVSFDVDTGQSGSNEHVAWSIAACSAQDDATSRCVELRRGVNLGSYDFKVKERVLVTGVGDFTLRAAVRPRSSLDLMPEDNTAGVEVAVLAPGSGMGIGPI